MRFNFSSKIGLGGVAVGNGFQQNKSETLQFSASHPVVGAVIPGASNSEQIIQNTASLKARIPADLWAELKQNKLIEMNAPV